MGATEETLIQQMVRDGVPLPDKIANAPELARGLELYFMAFQELTTCRSLGMSVGPIPWTAIKLFCDEHEIEGEQRDDAFYLVKALDDAYREYLDKQADKDKKGKGIG